MCAGKGGAIGRRDSRLRGNDNGGGFWEEEIASSLSPLLAMTDARLPLLAMTVCTLPLLAMTVCMFSFLGVTVFVISIAAIPG